MQHDDVIEELWRIKDEIAAEYNYDIHALVKALREDKRKVPTARLVHSVDDNTAIPRQ